MSVEIVEIYENRDMAERDGALSVPKTFINGEETSQGLESEEAFIESLISGRKATVVVHSKHALKEKYDVVIFGAGPAGLTAAIYAQRSGLDTAIFERATIGGQIAITPIVENYPGFPRIAGNTLVEMMAKQAMQYVPIAEGMAVSDVRVEGGTFRLATERGEFAARAIILATGASHRKLGAKGEEALGGRGVSYCSTCDGYLFKDGKRVIVVGGGNSALTDALYLDSIGAKVSIVHRGDSFRAEQRLQDSVRERGIEARMQSELSAIHGKAHVEAVSVKGPDGKVMRESVDGVFISIGYEPNTDFARRLGVEITKAGYIKADATQRTSVPHVYAAGDVTGGVKQITVAVAQGSVAAISAFEDLNQKRVRT